MTRIDRNNAQELIHQYEDYLNETAETNMITLGLRTFTYARVFRSVDPNGYAAEFDAWLDNEAEAGRLDVWDVERTWIAKSDSIPFGYQRLSDATLALRLPDGSYFEPLNY